MAGVWTGTLTLGGAVGAGRVLTATQGAVTGNSNAFTVQALNRSPPTARFTATPRVIIAGQSVTFDASSSSDQQTATASLQVSWDFTGAAPSGPPWSAWTTTKTAVNTFATAGTYAVRLAVRDTDGDLGSAVGWVQVLPSGSTNRCTVDTTSLTDDGASSCTNKGFDNRLSITEAVRLSNSMAGTQIITFSGAMTISGGNTLGFTSSADVVAPPGVILVGLRPTVSGGATVRLFGLELSGQTMAMTVAAGSTLQVYDSNIHNAQAIQNAGTLLVDGVTFASCDRCIITEGNTTVRHSLFRSSTVAIDTNDTCTTNCTCSSATAIDIYASVFSANATGMSVDCNSAALVRNNTFEANGTAIEWNGGGTTHVLVNNIFTNNTVTAASCGTATFAQRHHHLLRGNASDGCLGADANLLTSDPIYVLPASFDFRLTLTSPAIDTAQDLSLPLNRTAPPNFLGAGPDRGGRESY